MIDRRSLLIGGAALSVARAAARAATPLAWQTTAPAEAGFVPDFASRLDRFLTNQAQNIHGVVIVRRGRLVLERYREGFDPAGEAQLLHDLRSVTKSVIGLLYGIALDEAKAPGLDAPLLAQFRRYTDLPDMAQRRRWTIRHAITMTLGLDWDEVDRAYGDPGNGHTAMEAAPDLYRHVLEQPIVSVAGERWTYCSGATALLGKILEIGTKQPLHDYARAVLFDPLGIGPTEWLLGGGGERDFAGGLRMRARDLARIGQMILDGGKAGERQIVPAAWLADSFKPAAKVNDRRQYGYHWFMGTLPYAGPDGQRQARWIAAAGYGGQRLIVFPELDLVAVITAGNFGLRTRASEDLILELVLPSLQ
jgi:CubicO group peptidase (beta-lactamase class C family)